VKDPNAALQGLKSTQKGGVWTWKPPMPASNKKAKEPAATPLFGMAKGGYLVLANSEAQLVAFRKPSSTLVPELAAYATWMESHDVSAVITKAAVAESARSLSESMKPAAEAPKAGEGPVAEPSKTGTRLKAKLTQWAAMATSSVHHVLGSMDVSEDGGLTCETRALLIKDSPLSQELGKLPKVAGHPLRGLATQEFALAFGGEWGMLFDVQAAIFESLDTGGKVRPETSDRFQRALAAQAGLVQSMAGMFAAPAPGAALMSGLTSLLRVSDSQAYLAAMAETAKAQKDFFQELGMADAVSFTSDLLPGVPSCGLTTRLSRQDDPAAASTQMVMMMLFGGESMQMSMGALDGQRVLSVLGGSELLKARLEEARKAPEGIAPSILAVEPDLGRDHRFALYLDPRGLRDLAQVLAGVFGGPQAKTLPILPAVPAAGLTISLDAEAVELRSSVRAETLKAAATLVKAIGAMIPARKGLVLGPDQAPDPIK
jgi:hypothetical protein